MPVELYVGADMVEMAALGLSFYSVGTPTQYPSAFPPCVVVDSQFAPSGPVLFTEPIVAASVWAQASLFAGLEAAAYASAAAGAATAGANASALVARAQTALGNNASFLANPSVTQGQALQQVSALTRQMDAVIRLNLDLFSDTGGT